MCSLLDCPWRRLKNFTWSNMQRPDYWGGIPLRTCIISVLKRVHWLVVHFWGQVKALTLEFKVLNLNPKYLKGSLLRCRSSQVLRSEEGDDLVVPSPSEAWLVVTWEWTFSVAAPKLWCSLPTEVCLATSPYSFHWIHLYLGFWHSIFLFLGVTLNLWL